MATTTDTQRAGSRGSVVRRFNLVLFLLYLGSVAISVPVVYYFAYQQVHGQANKEMALLVDMIKSIQGYVGKDIRPYFMEHKLFHLPAVSGIVATARVAQNFKELQPAYYIKDASDNPLNPANKSQPLEEDLLKRFRGDRKLQGWVQTGMLNEQPYLVSAAPKESVKGCLQCHGDPAAAPVEVTSQYGTTTGYHYLPGDIVGVSVVGVPLADVNAVAVERSLVVIAMLTVLFALIFITINLLVRRYLIRPVLEIARTAHAVSQGELHQEIDMSRNDEIGELARSFELMRRSLVTAMKRLRSGA
jgi:HAMP domain-containing protein